MKTKLIRMGLREQTISSVHNIMRLQGIDNKTQVVVRGIHLLHAIAEEMKNGSEVFIQSGCGCKKKLTFV